MFQFVVWLRALAALIITNAHYADVWPIPRMAGFGQFGNCFYFLISGFCLYHIKDSFIKWFGKRAIRIYPSLWIAATVDFIIGRNSAHGLMAYIHCYLYPTWYHFIESILLIYVVFYLIRCIQKIIKIKTYWFMLLAFIVFVVAYLTEFDTSFFHIESTEEVWLRFQFFESMLIGSILREKYEEIDESISKGHVVALGVLVVLYTIGKIVIPAKVSLLPFQIILPFILIGFVLVVGLLSIKLEKKHVFEKLNRYFGKVISFIAGISLEMYLCQYTIIARMNWFIFPINFIIVTSGILIYSWLVKKAVSPLQKKAGTWLNTHK